eukprot:TRINITY_DN25629_c0_g1_i2.p1 TRINITY_DN25629_c0_g1~~TRINITY_DN25629_c0_g1_i2.p1  ORF type:complete len:231 (+),score=67.97 TRINITY_DN25629_c0_g1_i2:52-744(+)
MDTKPGDSLVSYENPVLLSEAHKRRNTKKSAAKQATEDTLNTIVPPRVWMEEGVEWVQYVSSTPATKMDVIDLQEALDAKLQQRNAREMGICPVREELYAQAFDEVIRQTTVACAERGLLLLRVRDELRLNTSSYKKLYESSVAFGMRKALQAEHRKAKMESEISTLEAECAALQRVVEQHTETCANIEQEEVARRKHDFTEHQQHVQRLKKANEKLTSSLQNLLGTNKK